MPAPRNLLFIFSDEHQAAALACAGHPLVHTPHLDRLAARGVRFENAYSPSPICVPARAALATGHYVHRDGYWDNAIAYDGRVPSWTHRLRDAGIACDAIGKLHYRNESDDTGFRHQVVPLHIMDGIGQVWGSVRNPLPDIEKKANFLARIGAGTSNYNRYDMRVADASVAWINAQAGAAAPWMLFSGFVAPHFPLIVPPEYLDLYPLDAIEVPGLRPDDGFPEHPWSARMRRFNDVDGTLGEGHDRRRLAIASYFGLCTFLDAQVGRLLDALEASGQAEHTTVIYTSDHGECLGKRGRWGKSSLYRESTGVPLIVAGPGVPEGRTCSTPASLLDLPPTFLEHFGLAIPGDYVGRSLYGLLRAPEDPGRAVFSEYHAATSPSGGFMLADARWKYHHYVGYPPELFDLEADPEEARNLAGDPAHAEDERRMHARLLSICEPEVIDRRCKADQDALVARWGGPERAIHAGTPGASPVPL